MLENLRDKFCVFVEIDEERAFPMNTKGDYSLDKLKKIIAEKRGIRADEYTITREGKE